MKESSKKSKTEGFLEKTARTTKKYARAASFAAAVGSALPACEGAGCNQDMQTVKSIKEKLAREGTVPEQYKCGQEFFDANPDYFRHIPGGEFSEEERAERMETLPNGEKVFRDIGLTFYYVKSGDTISEIREDLSQYEEFSYLKDMRIKITGFNIPALELKAGMWLPLPLEKTDRIITDDQMAEYAKIAIDEMETHTRYGDELEAILKKVSKKELIASLLAIAKHESGGGTIGDYSYHRWEKGVDVFSFSMYHVLMIGPGFSARHELELTEGQTYHPINATKLSLAFMVEKTAETRTRPEKFFPIDKNIMDLAKFYNGRNPKKKWLDEVPRYYEEVIKELD